jgi:hypothetical protein
MTFVIDIDAKGASRGALRHLACLFLACAAAASAAGCSSPTLRGTLESDRAVAEAVLAAVAANDRAALMDLSLSKDEFEDIVWPTLPVSRPEVGMPMTYVWQDTFTKSRTSLSRILERHGGQRFELVDVESRGETTQHGRFAVSRKTHLIVRDAEGQERVLRLFGSIIRQDGRSKVYSYVVD